ncbi:hypothetical protein GMDG_06025 [Pseudogymnoascus destructans 20631-21]|uniref:Uncharacterized protein n=1 Tax=Pseudogymnoascus destructans (strain ATCC MYA-4855 / 20631-21) TaxID=658429 RepID=L8FQT8_PSED2|nr:hypothetical protein GMDG_06025 [Pseudogymnoascus destructans 20631-21]
MCAATAKGAREAGRAEHSSARPRILTDPTARRRNAQRDRCHRKELGGMDGAVIGGRNSRLWLCEAFMCHCGFSAAARPRRAIRWVELSCSVEWAEGAKRRAMSAAGARKLGGRSDGGKGQSRREGVASFIEVESGGRPVHARCPIGRAPNSAWHTSRLRLYR